MSQKRIFLESEGDSWLSRNQESLSGKSFPNGDMIAHELIELQPYLPQKPKLLEIGCSEGARLTWAKSALQADCFGIEPSKRAVEIAVSKGLSVRQGTADQLPYENNLFDVIVFGFCLYLCDRNDLFQIATEADRVLKESGWLVIHDFYSITNTEREYHHRPGVKSYKMDNRKIFDWNPKYVCMTHKVRHHNSGQITDDPNEWVATSVLRKLA